MGNECLPFPNGDYSVRDNDRSFRELWNSPWGCLVQRTRVNPSKIHHGITLSYFLTEACPYYVCYGFSWFQCSSSPNTSIKSSKGRRKDGEISKSRMKSALRTLVISPIKHQSAVLWSKCFILLISKEVNKSNVVTLRIG